jgi:hypothetical protein
MGIMTLTLGSGEELTFIYNADTKELTAEPRSSIKVTVVSDQ